MAEEKNEKNEGNLPDPVMDVLKDLQEKVSALPKSGEPAKEEPKAPTVPSWVQEREAEKKALGFTEEQMQAHERTIARAQAPVMEQSAWAHLEKRSDLDKYRKEIEEELKIYRPESRKPDLLEKIYFMVKGRHADSAPVPENKPNPGDRVASTRVSGGPGYSGAEGGTSTEKEGLDKSDQLNEAEALTAKKLGVDEKRFALARNSGRDITPLKKTDDRQSTNGADFELRRMQGGRR